MSDEMKALCKERAEAGDGTFAVAFALLELADQQARTASALRWLGTGDAGTTMGAIEYLGTQIEKAGGSIAQALGEVAAVSFSAPPARRRPPDI